MDLHHGDGRATRGYSSWLLGLFCALASRARTPGKDFITTHRNREGFICTQLGIRSQVKGSTAKKPIQWSRYRLPRSYSRATAKRFGRRLPTSRAARAGSSAANSPADFRKVSMLRLRDVPSSTATYSPLKYISPIRPLRRREPMGLVPTLIQNPLSRLSYLMLSSSTSKIRVALGGTALPAPLEP
jgi:hypothetical protein